MAHTELQILFDVVCFIFKQKHVFRVILPHEIRYGLGVILLYASLTVFNWGFRLPILPR